MRKEGGKLEQGWIGVQSSWGENALWHSLGEVTVREKDAHTFVQKL